MIGFVRIIAFITVLSTLIGWGSAPAFGGLIVHLDHDDFPQLSNGLVGVVECSLTAPRRGVPEQPRMDDEEKQRIWVTERDSFPTRLIALSLSGSWVPTVASESIAIACLEFYLSPAGVGLLRPPQSCKF